MAVAILSDLHMRDGHVEKISRELEAVIETVDREYDVTRAFVMGDLIEDCGSDEADRKNVRRVHSLLEDWSVPVTYLLGNHDVEYLEKAELRGLLDQDEFYGVEHVGETTFLYLDSAYERVGGATGRLGPEQVAWVEETLPDLSNVVVLVHHPVGNFDITGNQWFADYPERAYLWDRKELLDHLEGGDVQGTISGHIHQSGYDEFWGLSHVSVNAFSKELPDKPLTGTYAILEPGDVPEIQIRTRNDRSVAYSL